MIAEPPIRPRLGLAVSHWFERPGPTVRELARRAEVLEFKRVPIPGWLADSHPRVFHWSLGPGLGRFEKALTIEGVAGFLAAEAVELFSFDLGPSATDYQGILPLGPPLGEAKIFRRTEKALRAVRRFYHGPLAAENYNYYPTGLYQLAADPAFIERYTHEFDLGLVLDLAHAAITAHNLGRRPEEYFFELPLDRVVEIHLSRPLLPAWSIEGGRAWAVDIHEYPGEREWNWLELILQAPNLRPGPLVLIEYYKTLSKLKKMQECLAGFLASVRPA